VSALRDGLRASRSIVTAAAADDWEMVDVILAGQATDDDREVVLCTALHLAVSLWRVQSGPERAQRTMEQAGLLAAEDELAGGET
jgi:hypothetical protein